MASEEAHQGLSAFLERYENREERVGGLKAALGSGIGRRFREELGEWITRLVPVEMLVPEVHARWRPLVHDAMVFVVCNLSAARLAEKIVEQIELPPWTPPELRLLQLIAKVPGLQKIGQVLARNRQLYAPLRQALAELENGISDVDPGEIRSILFEQLGPRIDQYQVKLEAGIYSEASVSAVVRFTWRNPQTRRRERGVFKVLKPHIPGCYREDMKILEHLAGHLARKHASGRIQLAGVAETLAEIRLLLEREVDFRREQRTLAEGLEMYRAMRGIRLPRLIEPLSTDTITALTFENGVKVTSAYKRIGENRTRVAERLAQAMLAAPALAPEECAVFHADPHAGNILYDKRTGDLVILDWALTECLTRAQRRHVLLLVAMLGLRDTQGVVNAIQHLRYRQHDRRRHKRVMHERVDAMLDSLPLRHIPGPLDAMRLLDEIALEGVRFPAALLMFRKAAFTLEGVLEDVAGSDVRVDTVVARYALAHWMDTVATLWYLLSPAAWLSLQWSALTFVPRLCARSLVRPDWWISEPKPAPA